MSVFIFLPEFPDSIFAVPYYYHTVDLLLFYHSPRRYGSMLDANEAEEEFCRLP
jgi:hypothetical protein